MEAKVLTVALHALIHLLLARVQLAVILEMAAGGETLPAAHAQVRLHSRVPHHVGRKVGLLHEGLRTERTGVRLLVAVQHAVLLQRVAGREGPRAFFALML